jgi:23S rRNA (uracil1939-C5)-methyltransferase
MQSQVPVQVGQTYEVEATRLNDDGEGVATVDGFTVFVPQLLPGERANIVISAVEKRFARGKVTGELRRTEHVREVPRCHVFGACGGCQFQHVTYSEQLRHKREMVVQALARFAKLPDVPVLPTLGMEHPWAYRNQVQVPLSYDESSGRLVQGFFGPASHRVIATESCHLEPPEMEETIRQVVRSLESTLGHRSSAVHHVIVRQSFTNGEQMVILCVRDNAVVTSPVVDAIAALPRVVCVAVTVQPRPHGPVWGKNVRVLHGKPHLVERMGDLEFLISPRSFFQVNTVQAEVLYNQALAFADVGPNDRVLDAYCGTGTMSLLFARQAERVLGIEVIDAAVRDARANADHNHVQNVEFTVGEVERVLPRRIAAGERFDVAVVDPPRKGCHPDVLKALAEAQPRRIVYVSCNHVTLARDLRYLADAGYAVEKVQPVDMFPQTSHVECVSQLVRANVAK